MKLPITTITMLLILSCSTKKEKGILKYSHLTEWGLSGEVKEIRAFYYKNIKKNGNDLSPFDKNLWDRMTITNYNKQGMMDSVMVFNNKNYSPSVKYIYVKEDEILKSYLIKNYDTILYSKQYWISKHSYIIEIFQKNKVEFKESYFLDEKFRIKEIKREQYNNEENSVEFLSGENIYFNENNKLDSIRQFFNGKMNELILNIDFDFDKNKNSIKSSKTVDKADPYLIIREFSYY